MRSRLSTPVRAVLWMCTFLCVPSPASLAADIDLAGQEFTLAVMPGYFNDAPSLLFIAQSDTGNTEVIIEWPAGSPTVQDTKLIGSGGFLYFLPSAAGSWAPGLDQNAVSIRSDRDIVCVVRNNHNTTGSGAIALPHDALGTSYWITTYDGYPSLPDIDAGQFVVMSTVPGTQVTITPSQNLVTGQLANTPFQVTLNAGDAFFGRSLATSGAAANLSGTWVTATEPVAVMEGNRAAQIPSGTGFANATTEFCWPTNYWDSACVLTAIPGQFGVFAAYYSFQVADSATQLTYTPAMPGAPASMNPGSGVLVGPVTTNHLVTANGPIKITQWTPGDLEIPDWNRKPESMVMPGPAQFASSHTLGADMLTPDYLREYHFATIIVDTSATATFEVDGMPVGSGAFQQVGTTRFAVAHVQYNLSWFKSNSQGTKHAFLVHEGVHGTNAFAYACGALFEKECPIAVTGDVNVSGNVSSADIISLVNHVFKGGPAPLPCAAAGDVNCNGAISSSDIIRLVNYVFKGGDPPCDGCTSALAGAC